MKNKILLLIIKSFLIVLFTTSVSKAEISYNKLAMIEVAIEDQAKDGCWTNIGEVRSYIEGSFRNKKVPVGEVLSNPYEKKYTFMVTTFGGRIRNGVCIGNVEIDLWAGMLIGDIFHAATAFQRQSLLVSNPNKNLNNQILDVVGEALRDLN